MINMSNLGVPCVHFCGMIHIENIHCETAPGAGWMGFSRKISIMAMTCAERKQKQRASARGYALERECGWRSQRIVDASFTSYEAKLIIQNYRCPICANPVDNRSPLDHSHSTGLARGVLCQTCNLSLGKFEVDHNHFLANAVRYLTSWEGEIA
jgi:hypothetical protein